MSSKVIEYELKDGSKFKAIYNCCNISRISKKDFEELLKYGDEAFEQANQLQTIIENLEKIKSEVRLDTIDEFIAWAYNNGINFDFMSKIDKDGISDSSQKLETIKNNFLNYLISNKERK